MSFVIFLEEKPTDSQLESFQARFPDIDFLSGTEKGRSILEFEDDQDLKV